MVLESIKGPLIEIYDKIIPQTMRSAKEIVEERLITDNRVLKFDEFYTRNSALYVIRDGHVWLHLTETLEDNLILQNLESAWPQLMKNGVYVPENTKEVGRITESVEGVALLGLHTHASNHVHLAVFDLTRDNKVVTLNESQRALAERIYGERLDDLCGEISQQSYDNNMIICVKHPEYVRGYFRNEDDRVLVMGCMLNQHYTGSSFFAEQDLYQYPDRIRGVPNPDKSSEHSKGKQDAASGAVDCRQ